MSLSSIVVNIHNYAGVLCTIYIMSVCRQVYTVKVLITAPKKNNSRHDVYNVRRESEFIMEKSAY